LKKDNHGIYDLASKEEHLALLEKYPDKILIVKFFAPWCRACKGLEPKFIQISKDKKYNGLPLVFAQLSVAHSKEYVKGLGILALPSIHIYAGSEGLVENFPCGPSKVPVLKKKIAQVVNQKVDPKTYELKEACESGDESEPCTERSIAGTGTGTETKLSVGDVVVSQETIDYLKTIPFFLDFTEEEFDTLMAKSTYSTFEAGAIIMKQGMPGETFYVIDNGSVEIIVKGAFEDPLTTPSGYLGTCVNQLDKNNYFGERSLITGQPRAASIRAVEKTRCFTFDMADIPASSSLSGRRNPTKERIEQVNDKYAVDYYNINLIDNQFTDANKLSQVRGSYNKPGVIAGVDTDDDDTDEILAVGGPVENENGRIFTPSYSSNDAVLTLLVRFKLLRQAGKCFEYILDTSPKWGDSGEVSRRSLLVSKLTPAQRSEFMDVFRMIDSDHDGTISMPEMKKALDAIGNDQRSDAEIQEMINKADPSVDGNSEITATEFMGVMAEAEFYYLFKETFATLDPQNSGYVQAGKLDNILCGLRDLISDDRKSIIDIDDKDMLIDYETFSRMMTGAVYF
jgi:calmodulin